MSSDYKDGIDRRRFLKLAAAAPLAMAAPAVLPATPASAARSRSNPLAQMDPTAGRWRPWLISSVNALVPPRPPGHSASVKEAKGLLPLQNQRTDEVRALVQFWDAQGGVPAWSNVLLDKVKATSTNPVLASRAMALLQTAMADATLAVWNAKFRYLRFSPSRLVRPLTSISNVPEFLPSYPSEHAAVGAAAATVLNYLFPNSPNGVVHGTTLTFDQMAEEAAQSRLFAGTNYPTDLSPAVAIGQACGKAAVQRGQNDGSSVAWTGTVPVGAPYWIPTPPAFQQNPLLPLAGTWRPWLLSSGDQLRLAAPNVYVNGQFTDSFLQQVQEVADLAASLTPEQKQIAQFWADGGGTVTPPGHWMQFAIAHVLKADLSTPRAARVLALLGAAVADAAISCWDCKFAYWIMRPVSAIRTIPNQAFSNPNFSSFIATPPFPSYTSGHSTFSGASSTILEHFFPAGRVPDAFNRHVNFGDAADQAAVSRLYGGIHYRMDNEDGLTAGRAIGELAIQRAQTDGAGTSIW